MKILISGYYGFGNLGDEAILRTLLRIVQSRYPKAELVVLSKRPEETERLYGFRALNRWNLIDIISELKSTSLFISGGGGLIQDRTSWRSPLYYLALIKLAKRFCPVVMLGQGIGPISRGWVRLLTWRVARELDLAVVRDSQSAQELIAANLDEDKIETACDLAVLNWPFWERVRDSWDSASYVGVCLSKDLKSSAVPEMARQLDAVHAMTNLPTLFIMFNPEEDRDISERVANSMSSPTQLIAPSLDDLRDCYSQIRYLIGMRLHSLIYALLAKRSFVAISDDPKQQRFLSQISDQIDADIPHVYTSDIEKDGCCILNSFSEIYRSLDIENLRIGLAGRAMFEHSNRTMNNSFREISDLLKLDSLHE